MLRLSQLGREERVSDRRVCGRGGGRREDGEEESGYSNADEDEDESLLAEEVVNRPSHAQPRRLRRVGVAHGLRLVASEYQLGSHSDQDQTVRRCLNLESVTKEIEAYA